MCFHPCLKLVTVLFTGLSILLLNFWRKFLPLVYLLSSQLAAWQETSKALYTVVTLAYTINIKRCIVGSKTVVNFGV